MGKCQMFRFRAIMAVLSWFGPLMFIVLMVAWNTVQTQVQEKALSDIRAYVGGQEKAIDTLKASMDQGEAATKASVNRAVDLLTEVRNRLGGKR